MAIKPLPVNTDLALLLLRLWVGAVGVAHGGQKLGFFGGEGIAKFAENLTGMGVPAPTLSAWMAALSESVGGLMIALGLWPRLAAIPFAFTMIVAWATAHHGQVFGKGGGEYALTLAVVAIAIIIAGPGALDAPAARAERSAMTINVRRSSDRGQADFGWLKAKYTFSFARYHDPRHMGFRSLRVINEDRVGPGRGFGTHPHDNMEILTYIVSGRLQHRDSTGGSAIIGAGDVQHMTAGSGVEHSEINPSEEEPVHLLQVWLEPDMQNLAPSHEEGHFSTSPPPHRNRLRLVAAKDPADGALPIHQDVRLFAATLDAGSEVKHGLGPGRHAWVQLIRGGLDVNGTTLAAGDGAAVSDETALAIKASHESEFLLFDLA